MYAGEPFFQEIAKLPLNVLALFREGDRAQNARDFSSFVFRETDRGRRFRKFHAGLLDFLELDAISVQL